MTTPKLSILLFCYNHERYVAEALDSIFMQRGLERVELLIADDCSSDGTRQIIAEKVEAATRLSWDIRLLDRPARFGMQASVLDAVGQAKGQYVAFLEGDDYWCDPEKLALQLEVLEKRPDAYLCAHNSNILREHLQPHEWRWQSWKTEFDCLDYLQKNLFHTSSVVMRNPNPLPRWMLEVMQLDFALVLWGAKSGCGQIHFIPRAMSVYRKHTGGISQSKAHQNVEASYRSYFILLEGIRQVWPEEWRGYVERREREAKAMWLLSQKTGASKFWFFLTKLLVLWRPAMVRFSQWVSAV